MTYPNQNLKLTLINIRYDASKRLREIVYVRCGHMLDLSVVMRIGRFVSCGGIEALCAACDMKGVVRKLWEWDGLLIEVTQ